MGVVQAIWVVLTSRLVLDGLGTAFLILVGGALGALWGALGATVCSVRGWDTSPAKGFSMGTLLYAGLSIGALFAGFGVGIVLGPLLLVLGATRFSLGNRWLTAWILPIGLLLGGWALRVVHQPPPLPVDGPNVLVVTVSSLRADLERGADGAIPTLSTVGRRGRFGVEEGSGDALSVATDFWYGGEETSWAGRLFDRGWHTYAAIGSQQFQRSWGCAGQSGRCLDDGFERYSDDQAWPVGLKKIGGWGGLADYIVPSLPERKAGVVVDEAFMALAQGERPWLVWVHLADPRAPYDAPIPFDERYPVASWGDVVDPDPAELSSRDLSLGEVAALKGDYLGEVAYVDSEIQRLWKALAEGERSRDTVMVVVGLHGEAMTEGARWFSAEDSGEPRVSEAPWWLQARGRVAPGQDRESRGGIQALGQWVYALTETPED